MEAAHGTVGNAGLNRVHDDGADGQVTRYLEGSLAGMRAVYSACLVRHEDTFMLQTEIKIHLQEKCRCEERKRRPQS